MLAALLPGDSPSCQVWQSAVEYLGIYGGDFDKRLAALDAYLDLVEETLETWAAREWGVKREQQQYVSRETKTVCSFQKQCRPFFLCTSAIALSADVSRETR